MDLSEFLLARLAEDQAWAIAAGGLTWTANLAGCCIKAGSDLLVHLDRHDPHLDLDPVAEHIVRWDPARVLAEIDAKRAIVKRWRNYNAAYQATGDDIRAEALDEALHLLARPYAEHPDYREEWRP